MPTNQQTRCFGSPDDPLMMSYHDNEWGVPFHNDQKQFEFLCLESMQAGLSWKTILDKRENFRKAFANSTPRRSPPSPTPISNASCPMPESSATDARSRPQSTTPRRFLEIQKEFGSFDAYIWQFTGNKVLRRDTRPCPPRPPSPKPSPRTSRPVASNSWAPSSSTPTCRPPARSTTTTPPASAPPKRRSKHARLDTILHRSNRRRSHIR